MPGIGTPTCSGWTGRKCLLLTHTATLFSIFEADVRAVDLRLQELILARTADRRVLECMKTARSQRTLLKESERQSGIQARESAYSDFLVAYRRFRRFLMTEPAEVRLVERPEGEKAAPLIDGAGNYWEAVDTARARLELLAGDRIPSDTWWKVHRSFMAIARVRATCGPGEVPDELVHAAHTAETQFIQAAREDLIRSRAVTQFVSGT
jgi:hypothetical protein